MTANSSRENLRQIKYYYGSPASLVSFLVQYVQSDAICTVSSYVSWKGSPQASPPSEVHTKHLMLKTSEEEEDNYATNGHDTVM